MARDFLASMADASRKRVRKALRSESLEALTERAFAMPKPAGVKLGNEGFDIIAEIKLRAPSTGRLTGELAHADSDIAARARTYAEAGAVAVSVLTEPERFSGSLEHLRVASDGLADSGVPSMRKDFLVEPYQVWEARAAGAGGVLLILQILADEPLKAMLAAAEEAGLFVLVEAFNESDLQRCQRIANIPGLLVGLNCRNLRNLQVEAGRFAELAGAFPQGPPRVAESGLATPADISVIAENGYDLALVGSALMQSSDPAATLNAMLEAGREVHA